jgi:hypothetical protein
MSVVNFPVTAAQPSTVLVPVFVTGVNDANPTNTYAPGVTVTRTGEGVYRFAFAQVKGTFLGAWCQVAGTTVANVKGYTAHPTVWDATNKRVDITVFNASQTAADVIATEYLYVLFAFRQTGVSG